MKRKVIMGVIALASLIVAGWLIHSYANSKNSYSGTIETREIQIGSKIGRRVSLPASSPSGPERHTPAW